MSTPLYKFLKGYSADDQTNKHNFTTYTFPSAKEDISANQYNDNYRLDFSKFVLLRLDINRMDMDNSDIFVTESPNYIQNRGELLVNSLRNYVANHEVVIKESMINNNEYFYNPTELNTTTEKIFWKWLRMTGIMQFEPAIPNDEYTETEDLTIDENLPEDYFKKYLWKERDNTEYIITSITDNYTTGSDPYDSVVKKIYKIVSSSNVNFKPNDRITLTNNSDINIGFSDTKEVTVSSIGSSETIKNNIIYVYSDVTLIWNNASSASMKLNYEKVVKYIGEISNFNNVQAQDKTYTEVIAYVPDYTGETPDVLFEIKSDSNYSPGMQYPILSSQDQPEIVGGEQSDNPMVLNPTEYPGDQYAYFNIDQKYTCSSGYELRNSGEYYGVLAATRQSERVLTAPYLYPEFDGSNLDGISIDFNTTHYTKMNIPTKLSKNFDEFNAQSFNSEPPKDFEFNAILWYYSVEDNTYTGENVTSIEDRKATNLYAITFLNGIDTDGSMPTYNKLVANGTQDGLSYIFSLNSNITISDEQIIEKYDENKTYSMFGFDLYNEVVKKLTYTIDLFNNISTNNIKLQQDINNVKNLLYTQTGLDTINKRIENLYSLLNLYKNIQIKDSDSIISKLDTSSNPPKLTLHSKDPRYSTVKTVYTSSMYDKDNNYAIDKTITIPEGKDFLINLINDDILETNIDKNLNIVLDTDLALNQTCDIKITGDSAITNKKLDILVGKSYIFKNIDLPIDTNTNPNEVIDSITDRWKSFTNIFPNSISIKKITNNYFIMVEVSPMIVNSFKVGDYVMLENFKLAYTYNDSENVTDMSGQYLITTIDNNHLALKTDNSVFAEFYTALIGQNKNTLATQILSSSNYTMPTFISVNNGYFISITMINTNGETIKDKYSIIINRI